MQRQALNGIMALFLGVPVVFKALFPGILSGIQGLNASQALNGTVATLNGIEWYCGPLSGVSSGIDSLSGVSSGIELLFPQGLLRRQALNGISGISNGIP